MKRQMMNGLMLAMIATGPVPVADCPSSHCPRKASVTQTDPRYSRFEGATFKNSCSSDADCVVGGCGNEVCAAEPVLTTCELRAGQPAGECGCVGGSCVWFLEHCAESGSTEERSEL